MVIQATAAVVGEGLVETNAWGIGYGDVQPWTDKWLDLDDARRRVEEAYALPDCEPAQLRRPILMFFRLCRELADFIEDETGLSAKAFVHSDPDLRVCDALAQVTKHRTRNNPNSMTARIATFNRTRDGQHVYIHWRQRDCEGTDDAVDLVVRCLDAWDRFIQQHSLRTPARDHLA
ncbi:hypothetical protein [Paractinoplanes durhamensis]|nr:hypothetical protein [Actinoplanes durhamensis]